jgi:hypothetical protein
VFVKVNVAGVDTPATYAVTVYAPAVALAAIATDCATPELLVVAVVTPPANAALAPLEGTVNVTAMPLSRLPFESVTVAASGLAKAVLIVVLCPLPLVAAIEAGAPTVLVKTNVAVEDRPVTIAVTA